MASTTLLLPLMTLFEEFSTFCFRKRLPFLLDSGSLLGGVRHRGIIPWDYDSDVSMFLEDYQRLLIELRDSATMRLDADGYGEPLATLVVVPAGPDAERFDIGVDVVAYDHDGRTRMSEALQQRYRLDVYRANQLPDAPRYDYSPDDLASPATLPLFCGLARVPGRFLERLHRCYDDLEAPADCLAAAARELPFDPLAPPVVPVAEFPSLAAGLRETGGRVPFLVLDCRDFNIDAARFQALLAQEEQPLFGYVEISETEDEVRYIEPLEAARRLRASTLDLAIIDSPVRAARNIFPAALEVRPLPEERRDYQCWYLMTGAPTITSFHADPDLGGGYMHLIEGEKYWWFIHPDDAPLASLLDRPMARVLTQEDFRLWGKVQVAHLRGGGCIYFPPSWFHRVFTYEPSHGVGGYFALI